MRARHLERAIALAERRDVELASLVTERFPLDRGAEAFTALAERRGLKVVVEPQHGAA
jgi:threonine dehydrogenase-like Zn-dependent dehydrogenase